MVGGESVRLLAVVGLGLAVLAGAASARDVASVDRRQLAVALEADLASRPSATETLQRWCAARRLADPPVIVARRAPGPGKPAGARVRALLRAGPDEPIGYRRVALACGAHVLSNADNWYLPGRLTAAMNRELAATDHPFGVVVRPLGFHRQTLDAQILVPPGARALPAAVIRNRALLETADGAPFSLVVETYTRAVLDAGAAP
jgi:hypothetical protein